MKEIFIKVDFKKKFSQKYKKFKGHKVVCKTGGKKWKYFWAFFNVTFADFSELVYRTYDVQNINNSSTSS